MAKNIISVPTFFILLINCIEAIEEIEPRKDNCGKNVFCIFARAIPGAEIHFFNVSASHVFHTLFEFIFMVVSCMDKR